MTFKSNITQSIKDKIGRNLHLKKNHPINTISNIITGHLGSEFKLFDNESPYVNIRDNFDLLLINESHVSRGPSDTYYEDEETVLRTHTSAHQNKFISGGEKSFVVVGDCYRRDEIDYCHYPVFHQLEGVKIMEDGMDVVEDLHRTIVGLIGELFPNCEYRVRDHKFPFTEPSFEYDVMFNGEYLEVLGCGVVHSEIMKNCGLEGQKGWAFGLGLDRLAMILFKIPDIRLMWSDDERFINQFNGEICQFEEFSFYPPCKKDVSFWINSPFAENDMFEIFREMSKGCIEDMRMIDSFEKSGKLSKCYRITYRHLERNLTNEEVNDFHMSAVDRFMEEMDVEIR